MLPLSTTALSSQQFQQQHLLLFFFQILWHHTAVQRSVAAQRYTQHLRIQEHPRHWIIQLMLKPGYDLWWLLVLDYPFVITLRLFDNSCWSRGKRMEYLKAVLANKYFQINKMYFRCNDLTSTSACFGYESYLLKGSFRSSQWKRSNTCSLEPHHRLAEVRCSLGLGRFPYFFRSSFAWRMTEWQQRTCRRNHLRTDTQPALPIMPEAQECSFSHSEQEYKATE